MIVMLFHNSIITASISTIIVGALELMLGKAFDPKSQS